MNEPVDRLVRLQGYLEQDPANLALLAELADGLIQRGQWDDARLYVEKSLALRPNDPEGRYRLAVIDRYSGQVQSAASAIEELIREGHDVPVLRMELARAQSTLGNFEACLQTLGPLSALALPADLAEASVLLQVRARHHLNELDAAIELAEGFLKLKPDSPSIASALATLYLDLQRTGEAAQLFQAWQHRAVANSEMQTVGGFLALEQADVRVALARFEQSLFLSAQSGRAALGLGLAKAAAGDLASAKSALARATELMPTHLGSWHALAWMRLLDSELDAAEDAFNQALAVDRTFADNFGGLAIIAAIRGDRAKADELIRTGHRLDKASLNVGMAVILQRHGGVLAGKDLLDNALSMFQSQALASNPGMKLAFERLLANRASGLR
ncbi:hypothetical protein DBR47_03510 [Paucibacter sp. KBW04]|uniref:tetratricopeptide repeat protein n=1 Tax=Paucibacter sp. KBW04 TaxID=2153361 RepID=UPI000F57522B|nr:tetratricopeptide repeat protein [Paucibacter sp. KBW04]RQO63604.1 hypothetical protein DBR47_03510 [Paucibacter sp. KBW04]